MSNISEQIDAARKDGRGPDVVVQELILALEARLAALEAAAAAKAPINPEVAPSA